MKDALRFFGLSFHDMAKVQVRISDNEIRFSYEDNHVQYVSSKLIFDSPIE